MVKLQENNSRQLQVWSLYEQQVPITQDLNSVDKRFKNYNKLACASAINSESLCSIFPLGFEIQTLGNKLSSCCAPQQYGLGVCQKIWRLWAQVPLQT